MIPFPTEKDFCFASMLFFSKKVREFRFCVLRRNFFCFLKVSLQQIHDAFVENSDKFFRHLFRNLILHVLEECWNARMIVRSRVFKVYMFRMLQIFGNILLCPHVFAICAGAYAIVCSPRQKNQQMTEGNGWSMAIPIYKSGSKT